MSERVNQINEALDFLGERNYLVAHDPEQQGYELWMEVTAAARDYADLLSRLEDGSAYDIGAKASFEQRHPDGKWNRVPRMSKRQWRRTFKAGLDALGLQEDADEA